MILVKRLFLRLKMKLSKIERQSIHDKYNGRCAYCGEKLGDRWCVDHIKPVERYTKRVKDEHGDFVRDKKGNYKVENLIRYPENNTFENLTPACRSCNIQKNSYSLEHFRENIENYVRSLNRDSVQYKVAKRYGLVQETGFKVVFFFEKTEQAKIDLERLEKCYEIQTEITDCDQKSIGKQA